MQANAAEADASVVTPLPDVSELALDVDAWRTWFIAAARQVIRWVPEAGVAIFYQSDVRHHGAWIDKGYLVMRAIEEEGATLLWHKIVRRHPPGGGKAKQSTFRLMGGAGAEGGRGWLGIGRSSRWARGQ